MEKRQFGNTGNSILKRESATTVTLNTKNTSAQYSQKPFDEGSGRTVPYWPNSAAAWIHLPSYAWQIPSSREEKLKHPDSIQFLTMTILNQIGMSALISAKLKKGGDVRAVTSMSANQSFFTSSRMRILSPFPERERNAQK